MIASEMMAGQDPESKPQKLVLRNLSMQQANGIHLSKDKYFFFKYQILSRHRLSNSQAADLA